MTLAPKSAGVLRWPMSISGTASSRMLWTRASGLAGLGKSASRSASVGRLFLGNCGDVLQRFLRCRVDRKLMDHAVGGSCAGFGLG